MRPEQTLLQTQLRPVSSEKGISIVETTKEKTTEVDGQAQNQSDKGFIKVFIFCFVFLFSFLSNTFGQFTPELCWIIADGDSDAGTGEDKIYSINHVTGAISFIGNTGTYNIESMEIDPVNEIIYAVDGDAFGTIHPTTGVFTAISNDIGNVNGAAGIKNIDDVDGLTYDVNNNIFWASERRDDGMGGYLPNDFIFQINPSTGLAIPNAFGAGVDYLVVTTNENDLDDIAMASDGTLYAISNRGGTGNQRLGIINKTTGAWTEIGDYGVSDVEGLAFTSVGQLIATTGKDGSHENRFYSIDPTTAQAVFINSLSPAVDVEACACLTGDFVNSMITGTVWSDSDGDGLREPGEPFLANMTLHLLGSNGAPILDGFGSPVTALTDGSGNYQFNKLPAGIYKVGITVPPGSALSPKNMGTNAALDSDFFPLTETTIAINLIVGQIANHIDAGIKIEEVCNNGLDDDGDGLTDCADPECGGTTLAVTGGTTICSGVSVDLTATAAGGALPFNFNWSHGLGTGVSASVDPLTTTTYTVTVTNGNSCTSTAQAVIIVNQSPVANAGGDQAICFGEGATISASATGGTSPYNYSWSQGLGSGPTQMVSPNTTMTYTVTVTSANGCNDTDQVTISVQTCAEVCGNGLDDDLDGLADCADPDCGPTVELGTDINSCVGSGVIIGATASGGNGALTYAWSNGHSGQSQLVNPLVTTVYSVTVTAPSGCSATGSKTVNIVVCSEDCTNGLDDDGDGLIDCADPDCMATAAPVLVDDVYTTCPGLSFTERVTYNDQNLQSPAFSIFSAPSNGSVSIDGTGKFIYTPFSNDCMLDQFGYQVCNIVSGCCAQATVTIHLGDTTPPALSNVPSDLTISCDDAVPTPPIVTAFDSCPGIFIDYNESSDQHYSGNCEAYTLTRTWTATDLCGNTVSDSQTIHVLDQAKPEIFQVYTLENGKRVIAGISKRVTHDWKYVPFPITFGETPMIFTTIVTANDPSAVVVRQRNPYSQGFELGLFEEEDNDGVHLPEDVAWVAIEPGTNMGELVLEAGRWQNVNENPIALAFSGFFGNDPGLMTAIQSTNDTDPAVVRLNALGDGSTTLFIQEEQSADVEVSHVLEHIGYLAFTPGKDLTDQGQMVFGETGKTTLTNAWATVLLKRKYTKPVVVFGGVSNNNNEPVNVRIRNLTSNSFEVRLQEWDYLDGNHPAESISWIAMEGAIPGNMDFYCSGNVSDLKIGVNVFAVDNCDDQTAFGYNEVLSATPSGTLTTRVWMAIDDCGNTNMITRYDTCSTAALQVRAILHGAALNSGNPGLMRDELRAQTIVPLEEPYSSLPAFSHVEDTTPNNDTGTPGNENGDINEADLPPNAGIAYFKTIADGNWENASTWEGGKIPLLSDTITASISIEHNVVITTGNLFMSNNSELFITNGGLDIMDGSLQIFEASGFFNNSVIQVSKSISNIKWSNSTHSNLLVENCNLSTGLDFINGGGARKLENVCLSVGRNFDNSAGADTLVNVTATVENAFLNNLFGKIHFHNTRVKTVNGNIWNSLTGVTTGDSLLLWSQNSGIFNLGQWGANVRQYCAAGSVMGLGASLPISEDCSGIPDHFNNCSSLLSPLIIGGDGNGTGGQINLVNIALSGTMDPALLTVDGAGAVVDWMLLEIRDPNDETNILEYATVVMLRDGSIVSEDGASVINFPNLLEGEYYVTLRHRNHLPLMTAEPIFLSISDAAMVDFTDPALPVKGGNYGGRVNNGERSLWGGDFNEDGRIIYQGPNNDVFALFSRVLGDDNNVDFLANFIVQSYDIADFNLDGKVIYQGPNNDRASLLYHSVLYHGGNGGFLANFIVSGYLP